MAVEAPYRSTIESAMVRLFVSSTFRDMNEEREELIKRVFPKLRRFCEERGLGWTDVDLRWGVTEGQVERGDLLPIIFAEIERCRPFSSRCSASDTGGFRASSQKAFSTATLGSLITQRLV